MKVLLSWLREFAPGIDGDPIALGETLSALGLAVEETTIIGDGLDGIVLAKVLGLRPHPDADKIQLVDVDCGDGQPLQVCCGAFNMSVGDLIPLATIGTVMPNGMEIAQRPMRGQMSNGMCCSASEIGLGDDHSGILLLTERAAGTPLGTPITDVLGINRDVLWDLEVNANRPDAMSVAGVARDLAAALGVPFAFPDAPIPPPTDAGVAAPARVEIVDPTLAGRFLAIVIGNVTVGPSPQWLQNRLIALGMRPINNVVDVSNYVMLELGQPNHAYDVALVPDRHLRVRRAADGETITTLDDVERTLTATDGVIANHLDEVIGIAGVMGGASTEISASTTSVLLEMAWWDPPSISRTVKRLNLSSEAAVRYRRGVDHGENMDRAVRRFVELLAETNALVASGVVDERGVLPDAAPVRVRTTKVNALLGTTLSRDAIAGHLASIGFETSPEGDDLAVTVPSWRWDTQTETDVIEEVARLHGYDNIERTVPKGQQAGGLSAYQSDRRLVRQVLLGAGCDETFPMPFLAPGDLASAGLPEEGVTLTNPLVAEESVLRTSLLPGQLKAIAYNQSHRIDGVRFFEIGHVFLESGPDQVLPDEREHVSVALVGCEAPEAVKVLRLLDEALALPNLVLRAASPPGLHPTRSAEVVIAGRVLGCVGEVDPDVLDGYGVHGRVAWIELDLGAILEGPHGNRKYRRVSKYPSADIDLAFEVPEAVPASALAGSLRKAGGDLLVELELFDVYRGAGVAPGCRSLAYRLRFQASDRTLTDAELAQVRAACIATAEKQQGASLRS